MELSKSKQEIISGFGAALQGRHFAIYVPSRDKNGGTVDYQEWMDRSMSLLTDLFGRCTAMPRLEGIWADESGEALKETINIVFCYVSADDLTRHTPKIRRFLIEMGERTGQAEVGFTYDGEFYSITI